MVVVADGSTATVVVVAEGSAATVVELASAGVVVVVAEGSAVDRTELLELGGVRRLGDVRVGVAVEDRDPRAVLRQPAVGEPARGDLGVGGFVLDVLPVPHPELRVLDALTLGLALLVGLRRGSGGCRC